MKNLTFPLLLLLSACSKEPNVAVRIDCGDYNDKGLKATLNGQPVGDCPVDMMVHAGEVSGRDHTLLTVRNLSASA